MPHPSKCSWEEGPAPELSLQACPVSSVPIPPRENQSLLPFSTACPASPEQRCSFSQPCARDVAVMPITLMEERHKIGVWSNWLCKAKQLHGTRNPTTENHSCPQPAKTHFFPPFVFFLFSFPKDLNPEPGHHFCGRRMVEQGLAVMGRGCTDALLASRTGGTSQLPCGEGTPTCPLLPGWALQAGPVSWPELKSGMGTTQKIQQSAQ